jgi:hypothetical protein
MVRNEYRSCSVIKWKAQILCAYLGNDCGLTHETRAG